MSFVKLKQFNYHFLSEKNENNQRNEKQFSLKSFINFRVLLFISIDWTDSQCFH